ncbi:MAG: tRNA lysidine(34) synthetase TilS [Treponema sp.]|nr:tRNA lysidine(34) synthetase TilS [Treponema sp.]
MENTRSSNFENAVAAVVQSYPRGTVFLAAVSGGADSMAMLASIVAVKQKESAFNLYCLHIEHGIRPAEESRGDADFVSNFCKEHGIPCSVVSVPPGKIASYAKRKGLGIEAAARFFRHRALSREAKKLGERTRVLIAHTKDDMLETALMRIFRGAGPAGLAAMPVKRGRVLRPLLEMSRADVLEYLAEKNILWREDSTNADTNFLRNRIRHQLVPLLDNSFPAWKSGLAAMAETQSLVAAFIREETASRVRWEQQTATDTENFFAQPQIIREEALFQGIDLLLKTRRIPVLPRSIKRVNIRRFSAGIVTAADLGPVRLIRNSQKMILSPFSIPHECGFSLLIKEPGLYNLKTITIEARPFSAQDEKNGFAACLPLVFRRSFKDDFFLCAGKKIAPKDLGKRRIVSAVDSFGTAAFIHGGILYRRDLPPEACGNELFLVTVTRAHNIVGGTDV